MTKLYTTYFCGLYKQKCLLRTLHIWEHILNHLFSVLFCSLLVLLGICLDSQVSYVHYDFNHSTVFFCILLVGHSLYSSVSLIVLL